MKKHITAENTERAENTKNHSANSAHSAVKFPAVAINPSGRFQTMAVVIFHLLALAAVARLAHWPYSFILFTLALVIFPLNIYSRWFPKSWAGFPVCPLLRAGKPATTGLSDTTPPRFWDLEFGIWDFPRSLSPLFALYTVTALRLAVALIARASCPTCSATLTVPEPFASLLSFEWAAIFSLTLFVVRHSSLVIPSAYHARLAAFALAAVSMIWIAILLPRLIPAGVTGADPYAYVQMAVDLATRGTPLHNFPLAKLAFDLNVPIYPTLAVGYTIPRAPAADSATVWPPGFSVLLGAAFKHFGERALYVFNPFIACLCLIATYFFARRVFDLPPFFALVASALLLTSLEQTTRLSIPLADLATQLFTTLALLFALAPRRPALKFGIWALGFGISFALAYLTRYTQLLLAPGLLYFLFQRRREANASRPPISLVSVSSLSSLVFFAITAALITLPDFFYRALAFGSPFSFASGELAQFSAADMVPVTIRFLAELAADFNVTVPLILVGAIYLFRYSRRAALGLAFTLGPVILFHLPYHYLKLRDLLFIFPVLCALAAFGLYRLSLIAYRHTDRTVGIWKLGFGIFFIVLAFRFHAQLPFLNGFYTYGFLNPEQRSEIESIAALTPADAVIADSLNSGAIALYAKRDTIRPGALLQPGRTWTNAEFVAFARALDRPLYLLMDSEEMDAPAAALDQCCRLTPIAELYLPYYYRSGAATNEVVLLYRVDLEDTP